MSYSANDEPVGGESSSSPGNRKSEKKYYPNSRQQYRKPERRPPYVEDLRIKLNRKRQEREQQGEEPKTTGPPPDPNYNFLKDPSRDTGLENAPPPHSSSYNSRGFRRPNFRNRPPRNDITNHENPQDNNRNRRTSNKPHHLTTQPVNIKVELTTSTGKRSCVLDKENKLPELKHVPDKHNEDASKAYNQKYYHNRNSQRGSNRGRGRGRGRSNYSRNAPHEAGNVQTRHSADDKSSETATNVEEEMWDVDIAQNQASVATATVETNESGLSEQMKQLNVADDKETNESKQETVDEARKEAKEAEVDKEEEDLGNDEGSDETVKATTKPKDKAKEAESEEYYEEGWSEESYYDESEEISSSENEKVGASVEICNSKEGEKNAANTTTSS